MEETKMSEPRKKLKLINYEYNFEYGQRIPIFIVTPQHYPAKATIAEVNPAFRAIISHDKIMKVVCNGLIVWFYVNTCFRTCKKCLGKYKAFVISKNNII